MKLFSVYQPIFQLNNQSILGYEALLRGPMSPTKLFEKALLKGNLIELDATARELALEAFNLPGNLFINVHPKSLETGLKIDFSHHSSIDPRKIILELTEHDQFKGSDFKSNIRELKKLGIRLALDDFGHGFTNLSLIEVLEPDYIKLDRLLINNIAAASTQPLLKGLKRLADDLGVNIIAEGIETVEQKKFVMNCGIKYGQGWYLGMPIQLTRKEAINE